MGDDFSCWENERTGLRTEIPLGDSGDLSLYQTKLGGFQFSGRIVANYDYRSTFLLHLMLFHMQTGMPVPNRNDWNKKFFKGQFLADTKLFDLRQILAMAEKGKPARLPQLESKIDEELYEYILPIPQSFDHEIKSYPVLDNNGNLVYVEMPERKRTIILDRSDVSRTFEVIRGHMLDNTKGQRKELGELYSEFPFEAYEKK